GRQRARSGIRCLATPAGGIEGCYAEAHAVSDDLVDPRNFYTALLSAAGRRLESPAAVEARGPVRRPRPLGHGLTEYVLRTGQALLVDRYGMDRLEQAGQLRSHGSRAHCWLGVPLSRDGATIGVIAVQSYTAGIGFTTSDQE